jgi:hypothetical protein
MDLLRPPTAAKFFTLIASHWKSKNGTGASSPGVAERLDVRFTSRIVIWGGAADEFEEVAEIQGLTMQSGP